MSDPLGYMQNTLEKLNDELIRAATDHENLDQSEIVSLLKFYRSLSENIDKIEGIAKQLNTIYSTLSNETIPNVFEANGIDSMKIDGKNFILTGRLFASIPSNMKEKGFAWLREEAKFPDIIQESVNSISLSSFIANYFELNGKYPPEDAIKIYNKKSISIRKT